MRNLQGTTPLHVAAMKGHTALMKMLIDFGADPTAETSEGDNLLHLALVEGKGEVVKLLLERKFLPKLNVNLENRNGASPLSIAAEKSDIESIELLIKAGAQAYRTNKYGRSPLHYAARHGSIKVARALTKGLSHDQKINLISRATVEGWTALHIAAEQQHVEFAKQGILFVLQRLSLRYLLERKADPNAVGPNGLTPFHMTIQKKCCRLFSLFYQHGADISMKTKMGESVMQLAAGAGADGELTDTLSGLEICL